MCHDCNKRYPWPPPDAPGERLPPFQTLLKHNIHDKFWHRQSYAPPPYVRPERLPPSQNLHHHGLYTAFWRRQPFPMFPAPHYHDPVPSQYPPPPGETLPRGQIRSQSYVTDPEMRRTADGSGNDLLNGAEHRDHGEQAAESMSWEFSNLTMSSPGPAYAHRLTYHAPLTERPHYFMDVSRYNADLINSDLARLRNAAERQRAEMQAHTDAAVQLPPPGNAPPSQPPAAIPPDRDERVRHQIITFRDPLGRARVFIQLYDDAPVGYTVSYNGMRFTKAPPGNVPSSQPSAAIPPDRDERVHHQIITFREPTERARVFIQLYDDAPAGYTFSYNGMRFTKER